MADKITLGSLQIKCRFPILTLLKCSIHARYDEHTKVEIICIVKENDVREKLTNAADENLEITAGVEDILGSIDNGEEIEGITMTSMLFCKHGGLITPIDSGQTVAISNGFQFTKEQLINCGWTNITDGEVSRLNAALVQFGVTSKDSAFVLVATMLSESRCESIAEGDGLKYSVASDAGWARYKNDLAQKGMSITYD